VALLCAAPAVAFAHTAVLEQRGASDAPWAAPSGVGPARLFPGAQDIPDPRVSRAVYGTLATDEAFDAYRFDVAPGPTVAVPVQLLVPAIAANADFRPSVAVIGAGDPGAAGRLPTAIRAYLDHVEAPVPVTVSSDTGTGTRSTEYEPFVGESLWKGPRSVVGLAGGRTYYLVVWDPKGATGDYRVALGEVEAFDLADVVRTPLDILSIKLGLYGQHGFEWGFAAVLAGVLALVAALVVWLVARRRAGSRARGRARTRSGRTSQED